MDSKLLEQQAAQIADAFASGTTEALSPRVRSLFADVKQSCNRFHDEYQLSQMSGTPMYCLKGGFDIPLVIDSVSMLRGFGSKPGWSKAEWPVTNVEKQIRGIVEGSFPGAPAGVELVTPIQAREYFVNRFQAFALPRLNLEFGDMRFRTRIARLVGHTTLPVRVHTKAKGLRVRSSPACILTNVGTVFGTPTTPSEGLLSPGRYIFGVEIGGRLIWDPGEFDIPPTFDAHLVVA